MPQQHYLTDQTAWSNSNAVWNYLIFEYSSLDQLCYSICNPVNMKCDCFTYISAHLLLYQYIIKACVGSAIGVFSCHALLSAWMYVCYILEADSLENSSSTDENNALQPKSSGIPSPDLIKPAIAAEDIPRSDTPPMTMTTNSKKSSKKSKLKTKNERRRSSSNVAQSSSGAQESKSTSNSPGPVSSESNQTAAVEKKSNVKGSKSKKFKTFNKSKSSYVMFYITLPYTAFVWGYWWIAELVYCDSEKSKLSSSVLKLTAAADVVKENVAEILPISEEELDFDADDMKPRVIKVCV